MTPGASACQLGHGASVRSVERSGSGCGRYGMACAAKRLRLLCGASIWGANRLNGAITAYMTKPQQYANGRFAPGNKLGKGRPPAPSQRERLEVLSSVCSAAAWLAVCKRAVRDAVAGDRHSRQWLASYLLPAVDAVRAAEAQPIEIVAYDYMDAVRAIAPVGYDFTRDAAPGAHGD